MTWPCYAKGMKPQASLRTRVVQSVAVAREPLPFRELCERAVPPDARLLVLDLDRTLHLGRNMGELLGWEISAHVGYGPAYLEELEPLRGAGRFFLHRRQPLRALRYLLRSARIWGPPGLFYFLWGKLAARFALLRRRSYRRFGPEPMQAVQRIPQHVLFRQMASLPLATVRELSRRVWARHVPDQIVEREDVDWLRRRSPGIRVVLSSASPREVVETAAEALGIDEVIGSTPERINGGRAKLGELRRRYAELSTPGVVTVGISDTGYGEDHSWTEAFTHLVDVNSPSPFPPIVPAASPLSAIFSAPVLTRAEKDARARGVPWLDPRRRKARAAGLREFRGPELEALLAPFRAAIERLLAELEAGKERAATSEIAFAIARTLERARRLLDARAA
jgi:haloacid dehalogenase-like hydrolase